MASQTGQIVQHSLDKLRKDESFLPELPEREQAFTSLAAILSTPNHIHKSFLRVSGTRFPQGTEAMVIWH